MLKKRYRLKLKILFFFPQIISFKFLIKNQDVL
jgi:hypothetical protein